MFPMSHVSTNYISCLLAPHRVAITFQLYRFVMDVTVKEVIFVFFMLAIYAITVHRYSSFNHCLFVCYTIFHSCQIALRLNLPSHIQNIISSTINHVIHEKESSLPHSTILFPNRIPLTAPPIRILYNIGRQSASCFTIFIITVSQKKHTQHTMAFTQHAIMCNRIHPLKCILSYIMHITVRCMYILWVAQLCGMLY